MDIFTSVLLICVHTLAAWIVIELFVNTCHRLPRLLYILFHYLVVIVSFTAIFGFYFKFFSEHSVFSTTLTAISFALMLEFVVFKFLYSGEKWFLSFVDWLFPLFLATSSIYFAGTIILNG